MYGGRQWRWPWSLTDGSGYTALHHAAGHAEPSVCVALLETVKRMLPGQVPAAHMAWLHEQGRAKATASQLFAALQSDTAIDSLWEQHSSAKPVPVSEDQAVAGGSSSAGPASGSRTLAEPPSDAPTDSEPLPSFWGLMREAWRWRQPPEYEAWAFTQVRSPTHSLTCLPSPGPCLPSKHALHCMMLWLPQHCARGGRFISEQSPCLMRVSAEVCFTRQPGPLASNIAHVCCVVTCPQLTPLVHACARSFVVLCVVIIVRVWLYHSLFLELPYLSIHHSMYLAIAAVSFGVKRLGSWQVWCKHAGTKNAHRDPHIGSQRISESWFYSKFHVGAHDPQRYTMAKARRMHTMLCALVPLRPRCKLSLHMCVCVIWGGSYAVSDALGTLGAHDLVHLHEPVPSRGSANLDSRRTWGLRFPVHNPFRSARGAGAWSLMHTHGC